MSSMLKSRAARLLALGASGAVMAGGLSTFVASPAFAAQDVSLNPNATTVNLLDHTGYDSYSVTATPQTSNQNGTWTVNVAGLNTGGAFSIDDNCGDPTTAVTADGNYTLPLCTAGTAVTVTVTDPTEVATSANLTIFEDVSGDGLTGDDHQAPAIAAHWYKVSDLSVALSVPTNVATPDPIVATDTITTPSGALNADTATALDTNGNVLFNIFDSTNAPFDSGSGSKNSDGTFTFTSAATPGADGGGVYTVKSHVDVAGDVTAVQSKTTQVTNYHVTAVDVSTPDSANTITSGTNVTVRSGTTSVTYTAHVTVAANNSNAGVPVTFTVTNGNVPAGKLTANGTNADTTATVVVNSDASGNASLTVTDSSAKAGEHYTVKAASGGQTSSTLTATYADATVTNVDITPLVQTLQVNTSATLTAKTTDQWGQSINPAGEQVLWQTSGRNTNFTTRPLSSGASSFTYTDGGSSTADGDDTVTATACDTGCANPVFDNTDATVHWMVNAAPAALTLTDNAASASKNIDTHQSDANGVANASLNQLVANVKNSAQPAQGLNGISVTFNGSAGTEFATDPAGPFSSSLTVQTTNNNSGDTPTVYATSTKTGTATYTATVGSLTKSVTQSFANRDTDARNITLTPADSTAKPGSFVDLTAKVTDRYGNPVQFVDVFFTETGVGRFAGGSKQTNDFQTDANGQILIEVSTASNETGDANVTATVDDRICGTVANNTCPYYQVTNPAGVVWDNTGGPDTVAGLAAGSGTDAKAVVHYKTTPPPVKRQAVTVKISCFSHHKHRVTCVAQLSKAISGVTVVFWTKSGHKVGSDATGGAGKAFLHLKGLKRHSHHKYQAHAKRSSRTFSAWSRFAGVTVK